MCLALTDADWSLTKDVFSIFGTVISAVTVGVAIYFGRAGLHTWRKQLRGSADHDLARRLLIEAVWGTELKELMEHVFKLEREFVNYVLLYLSSISPGVSVQTLFARQQLLEKRRDVMYELSSPDDIYWVEMKQALLEVENNLRARLIPK